MYTVNASSESVVMSWKHNCTLECAAGIKMAAPHSLPVVLYMRIHFTQDTKVWQCTDSD